MNQLTAEQVISLAPDAASAKAGQQLGARGDWETVGRNDQAGWGEIKGSGKKPYQVRVDLRDMATKCSCPSRKFPCKHAIGLMLILAKEEGMPTDAQPEWVSEWLKSRDDRAEKKKLQETAPTDGVKDEAAAAKRAQSREDKVRAGISELSLWMQDLVRSGLAGARERSSVFWESIAARMIDAQAPGLARYVRALHASVFSGDGWQERAVEVLGRTQLLIEGHSRLDTLSTEVQTDVRMLIGWPIDKSEVLRTEPLRDNWLVVGQVIEEEDRLRTRRTWLFGKKSHRFALLLDFAPAQRPFELAPPIGVTFDGEVCFYPSSFPLRALVKQVHAEEAPSSVGLSTNSVDESLATQARALALHPWIERWPMIVDGIPISDDRAGMQVVCHHCGIGLPVNSKYEFGWELIAISGGRPSMLFGEWDGSFLKPLSIVANGRFFAAVATGESVRLKRIA